MRGTAMPDHLDENLALDGEVTAEDLVAIDRVALVMTLRAPGRRGRADYRSPRPAAARITGHARRFAP